MKSNLLQLFFAGGCLFPQLLPAQIPIEQDLTVDSVSFVAYTLAESGYSNYLAPDKEVVYRRTGPRSLTSMHLPGRYSLQLLENNLLKGKLQIDNSGIQLEFVDVSPETSTSLHFSSGRAELVSRETYINGKFLRLPIAGAPDISSHSDYPVGSLVYNNSLKSLYSSADGKLTPSFWEWINPKDTTQHDVVLDYSNEWLDSFNFKIPIIRLRHPLNVSGVPYASNSEKFDYIIAPYQYGMVHRYSGIVEWDVPEFSVHVGTMAEPMDLEQNNMQGYGGILWVGDDVDKGGVRLTSRNGYGRFYGEVSSENFDGTEHGSLRLRVVGDTNQIQFVAGGRGSGNVFLTAGQKSQAAMIGAGTGRELQFRTNDSLRLTISQAGNVGIGENLPVSKLDINGATGYNQLRLQKKYTPTSSNDPNGNTGEVAWDETYIYMKTPAGWKRSKLESF